MLVFAFFLFFLLSVIYVRMDFSILSLIHI